MNLPSVSLVGKTNEALFGCPTANRGKCGWSRRGVRLGRARLRGVDRKFEDGEQAWPIVFQAQLPLVQMRDRLSERETKAGAFVRAAGIEPAEAPPGFVTPIQWNPRSAIGDFNADLTLAALDPDTDLAPP